MEQLQTDLIKFRAKLSALDHVNGDMRRQRSHYRRLIDQIERILPWYSAALTGVGGLTAAQTMTI
jgi:hypothetical protein